LPDATELPESPTFGPATDAAGPDAPTSPEGAHCRSQALAAGPSFLGEHLDANSGVGATILYATGLVLNPPISTSEVISTSTAIRLVTFLAVGAVTGYFAREGRRATAELQVLAERDAVTGLPNTRASERAIWRPARSGAAVRAPRRRARGALRASRDQFARELGRRDPDPRPRARG
jgi:hypothetical protein